jgi:polyhydroxyalkanoate synthesis regulator phasin
MLKYLAISLLFVLCSCKSSGPATDDLTTKPSVPISASTEKIDGAIKDLRADHASIADKAQSILDDKPKIDPFVTEETKPILDDIFANAGEIQTRVEDAKNKTDTIAAENANIGKNNDSVKKLESQIAKLKEQLDSARQDGIKSLYTALKFFFGIAFLAIMAGLVLSFFVDRKLGLSIAGVGLLGLALATGAVYYLQTIAYIAMGIIIASLVICVGIGIWALINISKDKKILKVANIENVGLIEDIKNNHLDDAAKEKIFGPDNTKPLAKEWQSPTTVQVVKAAQEELKKQGEI